MKADEDDWILPPPEDMKAVGDDQVQQIRQILQEGSSPELIHQAQVGARIAYTAAARHTS